MSFRKRIPAVLAVLGAVLIAFIAGESLGAQYALIQEAQLVGIVLAMNGPIFSHCKARGCGGFPQHQLVTENDIVLQQHQRLESTNRTLAGRVFYYTVWPVVSVFAADTKDELRGDHRAIEMYKRLGCGLHGVICKPKDHSRSDADKP